MDKICLLFLQLHGQCIVTVVSFLFSSITTTTAVTATTTTITIHNNNNSWIRSLVQSHCVTLCQHHFLRSLQNLDYRYFYVLAF